MRKTFLCLLCVASTFGSTGWAQNPPVAVNPAIPRPIRSVNSDDAGEALDGNYVLTLTLKEKETAVWELGVVVASRTFNNSAAQPNTNFTGRVLPQENGSFLVDYQLGRNVAVPNGNSIDYRSAATKSSVLLRLGEPVQIIKDGNQAFTLKLERYKP